MKARGWGAIGLTLATAGCTRASPTPSSTSTASAITSSSAITSGGPISSHEPVEGAGTEPASPPITGASASALPEQSARREVGPYEVPFSGERTVYFAVPAVKSQGARLIANLHGVCNPPGYACGHWVKAGSEAGFLVCPTGDGRCGAAAYHAPTWTGSYDQMGADLERAIAAVEQKFPGEISREGAVLTGFSRGAYAAAHLAVHEPGRWRYLLLNEADVKLSAGQLRKAGVRAVALVAGERGSQLSGERRTASQLGREGFPARLWVMPGAGHHYSANIDDIMREAIAWLLSHEDGGPGAGAARQPLQRSPVRPRAASSRRDGLRSGRARRC